MVAGPAFRSNFRNSRLFGRYNHRTPVASLPSPLALRFAGQDHALEPGREYLLGTASECDLHLRGNTGAAQHARLVVGPDSLELIDLGSPPGTLCNGQRVEKIALTIGDVLRLGDDEALVVPDHGEGLIVPLPAMRAAARERRFADVRRAATSLREEEVTFQAMIAQELRRTPWFAMSLILHALLLLLLWIWLGETRQGGHRPAAVDIALADTDASVGDNTPPTLEVSTEKVADPTLDLLPVLPIEAHEEPPEDSAEPEIAATSGLTSNPRIRLTGRSAAPGKQGNGGAQNLGSGTFQQTVGDLRRSGLEIVFVFDSTGSMSRTILDTKNSISQMLSVLRALVPDARISLVTFRDRGNREEYLVRAVPLGPDFWRASNFVQFVRAEGGGDRPEDVRAGLNEAFQQKWKDGARRVVILAGDAPPHEHDWKKLLGEVRAFTHNGRSFVHTLVTSPDTAGADTQQYFAEIAKAGRGVCLDMQRHDRVMQRVLTLAFGREFDRDIAAVTESIEASDQRTETWALDLARRGGPELAAALRKEPIDYALLLALTRLPHQRTTLQLIEMLADTNTASHTRQALGWALQRIFDLPVPPVDPVADELPRTREIERLQRMAQNLPE